MTAIDILQWFGETTLAVSALILLVLAVRKPFAKFFGARAAYLLWLAPALRLFLPELNILPPPEILSAPLGEFGYATNFIPAGDMPPNPSADLGAYLAAVAVFIWIAVGVAWFSMKLEAQTRFAKAMMAASRLAPEALADDVNLLAEQNGLKTRVKVRISDEKIGPCVMGVWRPMILLPADFEWNYSRDERRLALAHEIAHIARGDMTAMIVAFALQAIQWPNPIVHWAFRVFRIDQEAACDAYVLARCKTLSRTGDYAAAILKSTRGGAPTSVYGLSLAHPIKERLMLLKRPVQKPWRTVAGGLSAFALTTAGLGLTASYGYAADDEDKDVKVHKEKHVMIVGDDENFDFEMLSGDEGFEIIEDGAEDGERKVVKVIKMNADHETHDMHMAMQSHCSASDGESEPVKLEWTDESAEGEKKEKYHSVICLTGDDAKPENRIAALKKAIDRMEANAKKQEERNKRMIEGLRKQLKEMEKNN